MLRFVGLTWRPGDAPAEAAAASHRDRLRSPDSWTTICDAPGLQVCIGPGSGPAGGIRLLAGRSGEDGHPDAETRTRGVVLGEVFRTGAPVAAFDAAAERAIAESRGGHLVEAFWGSWVALLSIGDGVAALRAPAGTLRCFHATRDGVDLWASDVEDIAAVVGGSFELDARFVAQALLHRILIRNETGLAGVTELLGGQRLTVNAAGRALDWPWRPLRGGRDGLLEDEARAEVALRASVDGAVHAHAGRYGRILHRLSGGLDSSIVLGGLVRAPSRPEVVCLTYFVAPGAVGSRAAPASPAAAALGDERAYARLAAAAAGVRLVERERRPADVDLGVLATARRTARPSWFAFSPDVDAMDVESVRELGADAVFTGRGGDSLFVASPSAWAAIDEAFTHGLSPRLLGTALAGARASGGPVWPLLRAAGAYGLLRRPLPHLRPHPGVAALLPPETTALAASGDLDPPWAPLLEGLPPGKAAQLHAVFVGHHYAEPFERGRVAAVVDPLLSQPVVETALRIPTATLAPDGESRGLARRAFADLLPDAVRRRRAKAGGDAVVAIIVRANASFVRALLMDGALARLGLLDRARFETAFAAELARGENADAVLHLVAVECWARSWSAGAPWPSPAAARRARPGVA